ncbi:hypothetical protein Tco_0573891, partial [Tanacetum coccineum]
KFKLSKYIFDAMVKHLDEGVKFLLYPRCNMSTYKKIFVNPFHTKKVFANMKRAGKDFSRRIKPLFDTMMVQPVEEMGEDSDHLTDSTPIHIKVSQGEAEHKESVPTPSNDPQPSEEDPEVRKEENVKTYRFEKTQESCTAGEAVTTASVDDSDVPTTIEEITLAQTHIQIKAAKPKVVTIAATTTTTTRPKDKGVIVQVPSEFRVPQETQPSSSKDKGKGIMIEPGVPLKRKDQISLDEQIARDIQAKLDAELLEEQNLGREQEEDANTALIELQLKEIEELTNEEKAKLFMELMEKRRKHFAALRAQEKRNRPPTKAQKRTQMSTYLKHMGGYTYKQLKGKSFNEIQKLFDKEMKRVNTFVAMGSEEVDKAELKKLLVIKKDEDIAIDAIPLATKLPVIIDYKLHKEGMLVHYRLIRVDGSSKRYCLMIRMLQGIDREDLEALWRIVKEKYGDTRPGNEFERVLWGDLKVMFEPDKRSDVWRILQGYRVTIWKLICKV